MDSSDIIARRKAQAIYTDLLAKFKSASPGNNDCEAICRCESTNCKRNFQSYEQKQTFTQGITACPCAPKEN